MTAPRVGDVVAWADVPDGALVCCPVWHGDKSFAVRVGGRGCWVSVCKSHTHPDGWGIFCPSLAWRWGRYGPFPTHAATIVALGLTGQESADDLRRMAEVFEVREALMVYQNRDEFSAACAALRRWMDGPAEDTSALRAIATKMEGAQNLPAWDVLLFAGREELRVLQQHGGEAHEAKALAAERLHAAGWRPGMTAEDAVRLLEQAGSAS